MEKQHPINEMMSTTMEKIRSMMHAIEYLARQGIKIARRTVAKYREGMGIPTSGQRKRLKRSAF